jgi:MYXO-CTERM domain-containing protein
MRRVARCQNESGTQLEVLESMLPLRNEADARAPAVNVHRSLAAQLRQLGGDAQLEATQSIELRPGLRGFVTSIHGSATDPRAPQGSPGAQIRVEAQVVMLPTTAGHVEIVAMSQQNDASALATMVRNFVTNNLRLDGSGVPSTTATGAGASDAGATSAAEATASAPRRHEIDLSRPLWNPGEEERPHATTPPPQSKSCGCRAAGDASRSSSSLTLVALLGIAFSFASRIRRTRRNAH